MQAKYTPGPWHVVEDNNSAKFSIVDNDGMVRAIIPRIEDYDTKEANARLISAAPETMEALKDLVSFIRTWFPRWEENPAIRIRLSRADDAITKAEKGA